jgi:hypothetical protein
MSHSLTRLIKRSSTNFRRHSRQKKTLSEAAYRGAKTQVVVAPNEFASGKLIYPYAAARR